MKKNLLILLAAAMMALCAGCGGSPANTAAPEDTATPEETAAPEEAAAPEETAAPEDAASDSSEETDSQETHFELTDTGSSDTEDGVSKVIVNNRGSSVTINGNDAYIESPAMAWHADAPEAVAIDKFMCDKFGSEVSGDVIFCVPVRNAGKFETNKTTRWCDFYMLGLKREGRILKVDSYSHIPGVIVYDNNYNVLYFDYGVEDSDYARLSAGNQEIRKSYNSLTGDALQEEFSVYLKSVKRTYGLEGDIYQAPSGKQYSLVG